MTITPFAGLYIATMRNPYGAGGYIASGKTRSEAIANVITIYQRDCVNDIFNLALK